MIIHAMADYEGPPFDGSRPLCSSCTSGMGATRMHIGPRGRTAFFGGTSSTGSKVLIGAAVLAAGLTLFSLLRS